MSQKGIKIFLMVLNGWIDIFCTFNLLNFFIDISCSLDYLWHKNNGHLGRTWSL